jgi:hypothetical protein
VHDGIRVAVGNHYFYHESLCRTFTNAPYSPYPIEADRAILLHYEMRDGGVQLLRKWNNLVKRHVVPGADSNAPWWEKRDIMQQRAQAFSADPEQLYRFIVRERRTLWGAAIRDSQLFRCTAIADGLSR